MQLYPVCIPTFKNRKCATLLEHVNEIEGPVYIFKYADDDYSNRDFGSNVIIVDITENDFKKYGLEWRGLAPKRRYIQEYMLERGIDVYFMLDDDVKVFEINDGPQKQKSISINDGLKIMQEHFDPSYLGLTAIPKQNVKVYKGKKKLSEYYQHSCFIVNGKLAHELDIKFPTERNICDDWPFSYYGFMKGANTYKLNFLAARTSPQKEKKGSTFTDSHREMLFINDFLNFSDFFYLFLNKAGNLTGDPAFPFSKSSKLINTFKIPKTQFQKDLYELCKTKDIQAVKDFLKAHGSTSMDFNPKEIINKIKSNREITEW